MNEIIPMTLTFRGVPVTEIVNMEHEDAKDFIIYVADLFEKDVQARKRQFEKDMEELRALKPKPWWKP